MTETLASAIVATLSRRGGAPALEAGTGWVSFADIENQSSRWARRLQDAGIRKGDRVVLCLEAGIDHVCATLGTLRAGGVLVPASPAWTQDEFRHVARDSGASLVIAAGGEAAMNQSEPAIPVLGPAEAATTGGPPATLPVLKPADPALLIYTSGTTGRPKGVVLSHGGLLANFRAVATTWRWTERDRLLLTLPCFHLHGLGLGVLTSLLIGSSIVLRRRFVAEEIPHLLERYRCTLFFGVPTMYNRLVLLPDRVLGNRDLSSMRLWVSGSAPLTEVTFERFRERFGFALMNRYGMTESGFVLSTRCDEERRGGVVGKPLPGMEIRIVDPERADGGSIADAPAGEPGELLVRGPSLFSGYWNLPEETARAFLGPYLRTGDLALQEPDGNVRILGRRSVDFIKSGGFRISAAEVEECLQEHPEVAEAAVVGLPDPDRGQIVVAAVTPRPGGTLSEEALIDWARKRLAPYKVPARVVFLQEIPRTGPGKFRKTELTRRLQESGPCAN